MPIWPFNKFVNTSIFALREILFYPLCMSVLCQRLCGESGSHHLSERYCLPSLDPWMFHSSAMLTSLVTYTSCWGKSLESIKWGAQRFFYWRLRLMHTQHFIHWSIIDRVDYYYTAIDWAVVPCYSIRTIWDFIIYLHSLFYKLFAQFVIYFALFDQIFCVIIYFDIFCTGFHAFCYSC